MANKYIIRHAFNRYPICEEKLYKVLTTNFLGNHLTIEVIKDSGMRRVSFLSISTQGVITKTYESNQRLLPHNLTEFFA